MGSGIQVWWWTEKWAETSRLLRSLCCAWRNSLGYIYWSENNEDISPKDYKSWSLSLCNLLQPPV